MNSFSDIYPTFDAFKTAHKDTSLDASITTNDADWKQIFLLLNERFNFRNFKFYNAAHIVILGIPILKQIFLNYTYFKKIEKLSFDDLMSGIQKTNQYGMPGYDADFDESELTKYRVGKTDLSATETSRLKSFNELSKNNLYEKITEPYTKMFVAW